MTSTTSGRRCRMEAVKGAGMDSLEKVFLFLRFSVLLSFLLSHRNPETRIQPTGR